MHWRRLDGDLGTNAAMTLLMTLSSQMPSAVSLHVDESVSIVRRVFNRSPAAVNVMITAVRQVMSAPHGQSL